VITVLLMSADEKFGNIVMKVPEFIAELNFTEGLFRVILALLLTLLFFSTFQVLYKKYIPPIIRQPVNQQKTNWDGITVDTILVLLNSVYLLFVFIQFKYFFGH